MIIICSCTMRDNYFNFRVQLIYKFKFSNIINLIIFFRYLDKNIVNIGIRDYQNDRFEMPLGDLYR